jgi:RNA polymerase sigma-70 factor, ECF subfamily
MIPAAIPASCRACAFLCPAVCDVEPSRALRAARACASARGPSDEDLVKRHLAAGGVHESPHFSALFERHYRYVVAAVCRISGRYDIAQDLAQDVFVKALLNIHRWRGDARFTTWLYAIARNCCYDYAKALAARPREVPDEDLQDCGPIVENAALRALHLRESRRIVRRLMTDAQLDDTEARAFTLHYAADLPLDAVTARLGLKNRSGAKAQIVSAKRKLGRAVWRWRKLTAGQASMTPWRIAGA